MPEKSTQHNDVSAAQWRQLAEEISLPLYIVQPSGHFHWANESFERLVGYSLAQLKELTWMDITIGQDVIGESASFRALREGFCSQYTINKSFRHANGAEVDTQVTAWRHPRTGGTMVFTLAETVTMMHGAAIQRRMDEVVEEFNSRIAILEKAQMGKDKSHSKEDNSSRQIFNFGNNSTEIFRWIVLAIIAIAATVAYIGYIAGWPNHRGEAKPPQINSPLP